MEPITQAYVAFGTTGFLIIVVLVMALRGKRRKQQLKQLDDKFNLIVQQKNDMIFWLMGYALSEANFLGVPGTEYLGRRTEADAVVLIFGVPAKLFSQRLNAINKCERMLFEMHAFLQMKRPFRIEFVKLPTEESVVPIFRTADKEESDGNGSNRETRETEEKSSQSEYESNALWRRDGSHR